MSRRVHRLPTPEAIVRRLSDVLLGNRKLVFVESIVLFLVAWSLISGIFGLADSISSPSIVAATLFELIVSLNWIPHVLATVRRVLYAFTVTVVIGTILGVVLGLSEFWEYALQDYITVTLALPSLFAVVFAAMWFGVSDVTPMVAGALISFPYITQNVYEATENIDSGLFDMSKSFGVSRERTLKRVVARSILPEWFAGTRYSFAICWKVTTLAELVAAQNGIGFMIEFQMNTLSLSGVIAWTALFTAIMLFVEYGIFQQVEKRVFEWRAEPSVGWA